MRFSELEDMMERHGISAGVLWSIANGRGLDAYGDAKGLPRKRFESDSRYKARLVLDMIIEDCAKTKVSTASM